jgi:hypothetical protein
MPQRQANSGSFKKGQSGNPGGQPKGLKHKLTKIKEAIADAFDPNDFKQWARTNKTDYYNLMVKVMPKELFIEGEIQDRIVLIRANGNTVEGVSR